MTALASFQVSAFPIKLKHYIKIPSPHPSESIKYFMCQRMADGLASFTKKGQRTLNWVSNR